MARRGEFDPDKILKEMQRKWDRAAKRRPLRIPVEMENPSGSLKGRFHPASSTTINNHGPVIQGTVSGSHFAWGAEQINQGVGAPVPGEELEQLVQAVQNVMRRLPELNLAPDDRDIAQEAVEEVVTEANEATPDGGKLRRSLAKLKGVLAPLVTGAASKSFATIAKEMLEALP